MRDNVALLRELQEHQDFLNTLDEQIAALEKQIADWQSGKRKCHCCGHEWNVGEAHEA
ncbi:MAG: hypothetical protein ACRDD8_11370 [Bacteroidales bacterium]